MKAFNEVKGHDICRGQKKGDGILKLYIDKIVSGLNISSLLVLSWHEPHNIDVVYT